MEDLNFNTQKAQNYLRAYKNAKYSSIRECYNTRPSDAKLRAEMNIMKVMAELGGHDYKILSFNRFYFTCAYKTCTGNIVIETPSQSYYIKMPF